MTGLIPRRLAKLAVAPLAATAFIAAAAGTARAHAVFNDGNGIEAHNNFILPLLVGFEMVEGYEISQFGAQLELLYPTTPSKITVLMSSFLLHAGAHAELQTYRWPITLNIYKVQGTEPGEEAITTGENEPGGLITTATQLAKVPYRPSATNGCPNELKPMIEGHVAGWLSECTKGKVFYLRYSQAELGGVSLPDRVIIGVTYSKAAPEGSELHVAVTEPGVFATPSVGALPLQLPGANEQLYLESPSCAAYAEPTPPTCKNNTFSLASQWDFQPVIAVSGKRVK